MRQLRNFQTNRCYHLVSRVAHRAFYLNEEERTRFIHSFAPVDWARDLLAVLADKPKRPASGNVANVQLLPSPITNTNWELATLELATLSQFHISQPP